MSLARAHIVKLEGEAAHVRGLRLRPWSPRARRQVPPHSCRHARTHLLLSLSSDAPSPVHTHRASCAPCSTQRAASQRAVRIACKMIYAHGFVHVGVLFMAH
eukprot:gnl/Chilomastix_cuspidata/7337.p4 GENE.gnl/Chilomastix_cuspidata/7337~~gnl/Chilomastix_cuspidata/7337.p4  ORF type:complete len:102 (+),score=11.20 gnl/Chilomastix_cuspidata/7337:202-507(+)